MSDKSKEQLYFNFLGLRTIKTVIAVFICLLISYFRKCDPMNSIVAAIIAMKTSPKLGLRTGADRVAGTLIGGIYGYITILLARLFKIDVSGLIYYALISLMIIPVTYTNIFIKKSDSVTIAAVVYFSVTLSMALTADITPLIFVLERVFETIIGIGVSVLVNYVI